MENNQPGRRSFIAKIALSSLAAVSIPEIALSAFAGEKSEKLEFSSGDVVLFQGDSITDAGRKRSNAEANDQGAMGGGYAFLAACELLFENPDKKLLIYNRGISGNKVYQLAETWDKDALAIKPDILSILVGVNDYWHTLSFGYKATVETYRKDYRALLQRTKEELPDVKLIIGEPFAILGSAVNETWFPAFNEYQLVAKELAKEFNAAFVPYQKVFDKALQHAPGEYWSPDGVHPSIAGAKLMAEAWLQTVK
jgi:lysophospholipase L1-like esterase